jgi:hypothetical protein
MEIKEKAFSKALPENSSRMSLCLKAQYAFAILSATYFVGRCVASWWFNV